MMTPKERAAMQQALDFIDYFVFNGDNATKAKSISTALREALAEQHKPHEECECNTCLNYFTDKAHKEALAKQAEQKPVAWGRVFDGDIIDCICPEEHALNEGAYTIPLYTHPVRTKDLTDDEIEVIFKLNIGKQYDDFARAVIAADREKNRG